ncbi:MAG: DUF2075 domain-containing protein [Sphingobacteriia bacterium]|nr:DUF2075 domain-containing protein [Sphingobacteriia bacterium]
MARMIPSVISPAVKSTAERRIFKWFKDDPTTEGWIVLHSMGIANHRSVMYGEVDFLVIAPGYGVFALEVKGGRVKRENGIWIFTNKYNQSTSKSRGPFEQANEAIFSIMRAIENKTHAGSKLSRIIFNFAGMFPDIFFDIPSLDVEQWQIFDERNGSDVGVFIRQLGKKTRQKMESIYGTGIDDRIPDYRTCRELVNLLRADFDKVITMSSWIKQTDDQASSLTDEQMRCLDQLEDNSRSLINGGAGTGKTLIAMEAVRRSVANNERTAFFCFNNHLADWIDNQFKSESEMIRPAFCGTFHSFLFQLVKSKNPEFTYNHSSDSEEFYKITLPLYALDSIDENFHYFDKIIIDEAQDLFFSEYLDVMDSILKKGIDRGKWVFVGDFSMQSIYNQESFREMLEGLEEHASFTNFKLKINCRNTRNIGNEIKMISGFDNKAYLPSNIDGPPVQYETYDSEEEQIDKLRNLLKKLQDDGVNKQNITILSPCKRERSIVGKFSESQIRNFRISNLNDIQFSTIHSFKGLENNVIIITDVETFSDEKLLYVGLSRARTALYIFESRIADQERNQLKLRWIK